MPHSLGPSRQDWAFHPSDIVQAGIPRDSSGWKFYGRAIVRNSRQKIGCRVLVSRPHFILVAFQERYAVQTFLQNVEENGTTSPVAERLLERLVTAELSHVSRWLWENLYLGTCNEPPSTSTPRDALMQSSLFSHAQPSVLVIHYGLNSVVLAFDLVHIKQIGSDLTYR